MERYLCQYVFFFFYSNFVGFYIFSKNCIKKYAFNTIRNGYKKYFLRKRKLSLTNQTLLSEK